jgi:hypothetical protein
VGINSPSIKAKRGSIVLALAAILAQCMIRRMLVSKIDNEPIGARIPIALNTTLPCKYSDLAQRVYSDHVREICEGTGPVNDTQPEDPAAPSVGNVE